MVDEQNKGFDLDSFDFDDDFDSEMLNALKDEVEEVKVKSKKKTKRPKVSKGLGKAKEKQQETEKVEQKVISKKEQELQRVQAIMVERGIEFAELLEQQQEEGVFSFSRGCLESLADSAYAASGGKINGLNIKAVREGLGLTQVQLAREFKVSLNTYQNWERGVCVPHADRIPMILKYFSNQMRLKGGGEV